VPRDARSGLICIGLNYRNISTAGDFGKGWILTLDKYTFVKFELAIDPCLIHRKRETNCALESSVVKSYDLAISWREHWRSAHSWGGV
jgi:hypothetical protein